MIRRDQADVMIVGGTGSRINVTGPDVASRGAAVARRQGRSGRRFAGRSTPIAAAWCTAKGRPKSCSKAASMPSGGASRPLARVAGLRRAAASRRPSRCSRRATRSAGRFRRRSRPPISKPATSGTSTPTASARAKTIGSRPRRFATTLGDVPVTAPKSFFGNLGHGSGMVELAVSLIALAHGVVPPTLNYETPDPECPVNVVTRSRSRPSSRTFVKLNHNATGQAAAVVVRAVDY